MIDTSRLCKRFGYEFRDPTLLTRALTHRSAAPGHNERLEFLGDAVLNVIISEALFRAREQATEGDLSRLRASLVKRETLASLARELDLGEYLLLGSGELKSGGYRRESILADGLEAVLGAIYLDGGFHACRAAVLEVFRKRFDKLPGDENIKDPKTRLQERLQAHQLPLPDYRIVESWGEPHARTFRVRCSLVNPPRHCLATGSSRRRAEQSAAQMLLTQLDAEGPDALTDGK